MRVAVVQMGSVPDAKEQAMSLARILGNPALEGADLILLPEASQRGFGNDDALSGEAEGLEGPFASLLHETAVRLGAVVIGGLFEISADPHRPFNTTVVMGADGLRGAYRKVHLFDALGIVESGSVTAGSVEEDNTVVVEVGGFAVGIQTCFDLRFPEATRRLSLAGAEVMVLGAAWNAGPGKLEQWQVLTTARAIESTSFVVAAAQPGPRYCGHSRVIDPRGATMIEAGDEDEVVLVAQITREVLEATREQMPLLGARRLGIEKP